MGEPRTEEHSSIPYWIQKEMQKKIPGCHSWSQLKKAHILTLTSTINLTVIRLRPLKSKNQADHTKKSTYLPWLLVWQCQGHFAKSRTARQTELCPSSTPSMLLATTPNKSCVSLGSFFTEYESVYLGVCNEQRASRYNSNRWRHQYLCINYKNILQHTSKTVSCRMAVDRPVYSLFSVAREYKLWDQRVFWSLGQSKELLY